MEQPITTVYPSYDQCNKIVYPVDVPLHEIKRGNMSTLLNSSEYTIDLLKTIPVSESLEQWIIRSAIAVHLGVTGMFNEAYFKTNDVLFLDQEFLDIINNVENWKVQYLMFTDEAALHKRHVVNPRVKGILNNVVVCKTLTNEEGEICMYLDIVEEDVGIIQNDLDIMSNFKLWVLLSFVLWERKMEDTLQEVVTFGQQNNILSETGYVMDMSKCYLLITFLDSRIPGFSVHVMENQNLENQNQVAWAVTVE